MEERERQREREREADCLCCTPADVLEILSIDSHTHKKEEKKTEEEKSEIKINRPLKTFNNLEVMDTI